MRVFAVWEPILPTDWSEPTSPVLRRLSDQRVRQFWDRGHVMAKVMAASREPQSKAECCERRGILWDLIAVYPAGSGWSENLPHATLFNGPVVRVVGSTRIL